jgi:hypothetical protein
MTAHKLHRNAYVWISKYCPRQFDVYVPQQWFSLGSLPLDFLNTAAKQVFTNQMAFCSAVFAPLLHAHTAHTVHATKKCYFGRSNEYSMHKPTSLPTPFFKMPATLCHVRLRQATSGAVFHWPLWKAGIRVDFDILYINRPTFNSIFLRITHCASADAPGKRQDVSELVTAVIQNWLREGSNYRHSSMN